MKKYQFPISSILLLSSFLFFNSPLLAKSNNHMTKVITVGPDTILGTEANHVSAPSISINLIDGLKEGDRFYLHLQNASWNIKEVVILDEAAQVIGKVLDAKEMEVIVTRGELAPGSKLMIPLYTTIEGNDAQVVIDSNNTTLSSETLTFATISDEKLMISAAESAEKVLQEGKLPKLLIEEAYGGHIRSYKEKAMDSTFTIRLSNKEFAFEITEEAHLTGSKAFDGIKGGKDSFTLLNDHQLQITLPEQISTVSKDNKGAFTLDGIKIKSLTRKPTAQTVHATVQGDMLDELTFTVLELGEYKVNLILDTPTSVRSGSYQKISFTLQEDMKNSLLKDRSLVVSLDSNVTVVTNKEGSVPVTINGKNYSFESITEKEQCVGFTIPQLNEKELMDALSLSFTFDIAIPSQTIGTVHLALEGRALPNPLKASLFEVKAPVMIDVENVHLKSGKKDQYGGSIKIRETAAGSLQEGKTLFIALDTSHLKISSLPLISVAEGDLVVGDAQIVEGGIELPILEHSTIPSILVLKDFGMTLDGTVPAGKYEVAIGGTAISDLSTATINETNGFESINPIATFEQFILVDTQRLNKNVITFKLGEEAYAINGKYKHLDTPPYLENGRVMVPIRYVAEALGIPKEKMHYDEEFKTFTLYAHTPIEVQVGSDILRVNGMPKVMQTSCQLINGEIMVPMSEIAKALDVEISWDNTLETATFIQYGN